MKKLSKTLTVGMGLVLAAGAGLAGAGWAAGATTTPATLTASTALAGDSPAGFYYGTDSWPVSGTGSAPYKEPRIGGSYGGYIGMAGNWVREEGCHTGNFLAWSSANSAQADTNYTKYHIGIGTGVYWYMGGPGVDPHYTGSTTEAAKWGTQQAEWTLAAMKSLHVTYPVVWADIEQPGIEPAPDNGWNDVYTGPCSWDVKHYCIAANVDRAAPRMARRVPSDRGPPVPSAGLPWPAWPAAGPEAWLLSLTASTLPFANGCWPTFVDNSEDCA